MHEPQIQQSVGVVPAATEAGEDGRADGVRADPSRRAADPFPDALPDAVARLDRRGRVLANNRAFADLFEVARPPALGERVTAGGMPRDVAAILLHAVRRASRTALTQTFEQRLAGDGEARWLRFRVLPEARVGDRRGTVVVVIDDVTAGVLVTGQRDALLAREQADRSRAGSAARSRDQFLAMVSHELRSPLNGIQSWSHVLENHLNAANLLSPLATRALDGIRAGIEQQVRLIGHLLDATIALTGEMQLLRVPLILREALDAAVAEARPRAVARDIALHVDMHLDEQRILGDEPRIRQVFEQLLSNAIKFTPAGGEVVVTAGVEAHHAVIAIRDSGKGLPEGHEAWLFEPFAQADSSNTRRAGGLGLGLALAQKIVIGHAGQIAVVASGPHCGSTFVVTLPLARRDATTTTPARDGCVTGELAGLRALLIDDQAEAREALGALLMQFGATVHVAESSRAGLAIVDARPHAIDVVICDIAMPEEDGYGFIARLRAREAVAEGVGARVPVIALSAFIESDDRVATTAVSFDFRLAKPATPAALLDAIARVRR